MGELPDAQQLKVVQALQASLDGLDANWLARIESAQRADPRNAPALPVGHGLPAARAVGQAQQLFTQAAQQLADARCASAWRHLAQLAEQRADADAAAHAWKQAALQYP
jgi:HemY protein